MFRLVIDFLLKSLSDKVIKIIYCAYAAIYCDTSRKNHYPQKMFAEKLFSNIEDKDKYKVIKNEVIEFISRLKEEENIFSDDTEKNKEYVLRRTKQRFSKIFVESKIININTRLGKIYDNA